MRSQKSLRAPPPDARATVASHAEVAQQVEGVGEPEGDAFEHGAHHVRRASWLALRPTSAPRASGSACGVRSPDEVGQEHDAAGAGRDGLRLGHQRAEGHPRARRCRAAHCSEPAAESITPMACQAPGTAWQNTCTRA